jgi:hypothetical protein
VVNLVVLLRYQVLAGVRMSDALFETCQPGSEQCGKDLITYAATPPD